MLLAQFKTFLQILTLHLRGQSSGCLTSPSDWLYFDICCLSYCRFRYWDGWDVRSTTTMTGWLDDLFVRRATVRKDQPPSEKQKGSFLTFCMKIIMTNQQFNNYFVCVNCSHENKCVWCVKVLNMNAKLHAAPSLLHLLHQDMETHTLPPLINCVNRKNQTHVSM